MDFAGSDAFLSDEEMPRNARRSDTYPTCIGGVVMGFNLEGIETMRLTGEIIADIYLGNITNWSDPK